LSAVPVESISPRQVRVEPTSTPSGRLIAGHPEDGRENVAAAVQRGREAAEWWAGLGFAARRRVLIGWRRLIASRIDELAALVREEMGKPIGDAQLEILLALDHITWAAKNARRVLGSRRVNAGLLMYNHTARLEYQPLGVVGVIGPWNYPVFTPVGSIAYALAAGNAVVFKPSEYAPGVGAWLVDTFTTVVGGRPVLQAVHGGGETGSALCRSDIDKLAFTGSTATGKKVMAACAENLTPVLIEAGGKDALIVDEDADLGAAADAALWGGMSNAGQTCIGIERVYVHHAAYPAFLGEILDRATFHAGTDATAQVGPITMPKQVPLIRAHIDAAIADGGRLILGGAATIHGDVIQPTIITGVPETSPAVAEETFGPLLIINPVSSVEEAVRLANASRYGLGGAVFSRRNGLKIARRLRAGMTSVNSVIAFAAIPALPFGGVSDSGFGRIHGADGLREFGSAKSITIRSILPAVTLTSFRRSARVDGWVARLVKAFLG
jgi:acyl-CoA reductase-like NAD-dependent aldehyde dehydrogenase